MVPIGLFLGQSFVGEPKTNEERALMELEQLAVQLFTSPRQLVSQSNIVVEKPSLNNFDRDGLCHIYPVRKDLSLAIHSSNHVDPSIHLRMITSNQDYTLIDFDWKNYGGRRKFYVYNRLDAHEAHCRSHH